MNNNYKVVIDIIMIITIMAFLTVGCSMVNPTSETGVVSELTLSSDVSEDNRPINQTTVFPTDTPAFCCFFKLSGFPVGAKIEVKWIYVGGDPEAEEITGKNYVAEKQTAVTTKKGEGYTYTCYMQPGVAGYKWPKGDYKVVISVDGLEKASADFKVQE